jgi:hypothetical protein
MPGMTAGWVCRVMSDAAEIEVEQLDDTGKDWFAVGPGGGHMGGLTETVAAAFSKSRDPAWLAVVVDTIERDCGSDQRSMLLVKRASGKWFHTTLAENRESISHYGMDWRRMTGSGVAGSRRSEADGVFLCVDIEGAEWFAEMGRPRGCAVDIWAVALHGTLLMSDPSASGGGGDCWTICPEASQIGS